jgi:hypothetical protein
MSQAETRIGATNFRRITRITPALMRALEATEVIHPLVSDSGWRSFSQSDVEAVMTWKAAREKERTGRRAEGTARLRAAHGRPRK